MEARGHPEPPREPIDDVGVAQTRASAASGGLGGNGPEQFLEAARVVPHLSIASRDTRLVPFDHLQPVRQWGLEAVATVGGDRDRGDVAVADESLARILVEGSQPVTQILIDGLDARASPGVEALRERPRGPGPR